MVIFEHAHYFPEFWFICVLITLVCLSKPAVFIMRELPYLLYRFYNTTLKEKLIKIFKKRQVFERKNYTWKVGISIKKSSVLPKKVQIIHILALYHIVAFPVLYLCVDKRQNKIVVLEAKKDIFCHFKIYLSMIFF